MMRVKRGVVLWTIASLLSVVCTTGWASRGWSSERVGGRSAGTEKNDALSVEHDGSWIRWWWPESAPTRWTGPLPLISRALSWHTTTSDAVQWGELHLSGPGEAWRLRVIVARIDPRHVRIRVDSAFDESIATAGWTVDHAPANAIVAINAGQFVGSLPWGWVVIGGNEFLAPGHGPLSTALVIDSSGDLRWAHADGVATVRAMRGAESAFQSYPTLLAGDGNVPRQLQSRFSGGGVDLGHRDARLAIGQLRDGHVMIALTRLDVMGGALDYVPLGLTTPEMAALMGALGCSDAVMLDGGISSQMMIRTSSTKRLTWRGVRRVPLGLVVLPPSLQPHEPPALPTPGTSSTFHRTRSPHSPPPR